MIKKVKEGNNIERYISEYKADTFEDLKEIDDAEPFSSCFVLDTGDLYMLNGKKEWVLI